MTERPSGPTAGHPTRPSRVRPVTVVAAFLVVAAVLLTVVRAASDDATEPAAGAQPVATTSYPVTAGSGLPWMSGASGEGATDGAFAAWRGRPIDISATWSDNNDDMTELWSLQESFEYADWQKSLDLSIGAIGWDESWAQAAQGAYDDRWRQSLEQARTLWEGRPGTLYLRFAHEMNGNWYPWAVDSTEVGDFVTSWQRFRALQQEIFPEAQLVFCLSRESVGTGFDWRESFPGADQVDVLGVDYYNQYPYSATEEDWEQSLDLTDEWGGPKGLDGYQQFAESVGLPMAIPEWSGVADQGDSPAFIDGMHAWFADHAGTGPGQLLYEILFDLDDADAYGGNFVLSTADTRLPESAQAYQQAWRES